MLRGSNNLRIIQVFLQIDQIDPPFFNTENDCTDFHVLTVESFLKLATSDVTLFACKLKNFTHAHHTKNACRS